jgi:hypothetical protein
MNILIVIFIGFFKAVGNASVQLLQDESPYVTAMVISHLRLRNEYKGQMSHT